MHAYVYIVAYSLFMFWGLIVRLSSAILVDCRPGWRRVFVLHKIIW